jgi:hypothetical protein
MQWVAFYGGYDKITPAAWVEWDHLYEVRQRMQKLGARPSTAFRTVAVAWPA